MADPKGFLKYPRHDPSRRDVHERIKDWKDLYVPMTEEEIKYQASRCMDCGVAFCQGPTGCPVENLIPEWNDLITRGRWKDALSALHLTNNFPEFTGKLCPAPCESACVLGINSTPVTIRNMESNIIDRGFNEGWVLPLIPAHKSGKTVAVVGSGPSGLAAAQQLARAGHSVTVFEKSDSIGGLLRYGIPDFKLEKWMLDRRLDQMSKEGIEFKVGVELGKDILLSELKKQFNAVVLTIGAERPRDLPIPGRNLPGIHFAMEYLVQQNKFNSGKTTGQPTIHAKGKRVVIIGGGDTGSDCLGTAHRQGCLEAHQFELLPKPPASRDGSTPWPAWPMMLRSSHAHEEGGNRNWSVSTTEFVGDQNGVKFLRGVKVSPTPNGFEKVAGSEFELPVDLVLLAMGFTGPRPDALDPSHSLSFTSRGNISVNASFETSIPGVFASGDAVRGQSLIVWAIADGRKTARAVHQFLLNS